MKKVAAYNTISSNASTNEVKSVMQFLVAKIHRKGIKPFAIRFQVGYINDDLIRDVKTVVCQAWYYKKPRFIKTKYDERLNSEPGSKWQRKLSGKLRRFRAIH